MNNIVNENKLFFDRKNKQFYFYDETGKKKNVKGPKDAIQNFTKQTNKRKLKKRTLAKTKKNFGKTQRKANIFRSIKNPKNEQLIKEFKTQVFDVIAATQKKTTKGKPQQKIKSLRSAQLASERLQQQAKNQDRLFQMQLMRLLMKEQEKIKKIAKEEEKEKDKKLKKLDEELKKLQQEEKNLEQRQLTQLFEKDNKGISKPKQVDEVDYIFRAGNQLFDQGKKYFEKLQVKPNQLSESAIQLGQKAQSQINQPQQTDQPQQKENAFFKFGKKALESSNPLIGLGIEGVSYVINNRRNNQLMKEQKIETKAQKQKLLQQQEEILMQKYYAGGEKEPKLYEKAQQVGQEIVQIQNEIEQLQQQPVDFIDNIGQNISRIGKKVGEQVSGIMQSGASLLNESFNAGKNKTKNFLNKIGSGIKSFIGLQKEQLDNQILEKELSGEDVSELKQQKKSINKSLSKSKEKIAEIFIEQLQKQENIDSQNIQQKINQVISEKKNLQDLEQQSQISYQEFQQELTQLIEQSRMEENQNLENQQQQQPPKQEEISEKQLQQSQQESQQQQQKRKQWPIDWGLPMDPKQYQQQLKEYQEEKQQIEKQKTIEIQNMFDQIYQQLNQLDDQVQYLKNNYDIKNINQLEDLQKQLVEEYQGIQKILKEKNYYNFKKQGKYEKLTNFKYFEQPVEKKEIKQQNRIQRAKELLDNLISLNQQVEQKKKQIEIEQREKQQQQQKEQQAEIIQQEEQQQQEQEQEQEVNFGEFQNEFQKIFENAKQKASKYNPLNENELKNQYDKYMKIFQQIQNDKSQQKENQLKILKNQYIQEVQQKLKEFEDYEKEFEDYEKGYGKFYKSYNDFQGLTMKEFKDIFYTEIAPNIEEEFQFAFIEEEDEIPQIPQRYYNPKNKDQFWNIAVFFVSSKDDPESFNKHFTVFIHDFEIQEIYYYDPLGLIANDNFKTAQKKIQQYIEKQPQIIKLKINSVNTQKSEFLAGSQENDQNYCGIYSLIFIDRICVQGQSFKQATNFDNLSKPEQEIQTDILKQYSVIEQKGQGYQFIYQ